MGHRAQWVCAWGADLVRCMSDAGPENRRWYITALTGESHSESDFPWPFQFSYPIQLSCRWLSNLLLFIKGLSPSLSGLLNRDRVKLRSFLIFISTIERGLDVMSSVCNNCEGPLNGQAASHHSCILMGSSIGQVPLLALSPCLTRCLQDNGICFLSTSAEISFNSISSA